MKFENKVYNLVRRVPKGKLTTYGELAKALGCKCYQLIGQVMARNPYAPEVACHRVVKSDGSLGGFGGGGDNKQKKELLEKEGITVENGRIKDFEKRIVRFI
jgi:O-6-methylguanine DNA methyltransferase